MLRVDSDSYCLYLINYSSVNSLRSSLFEVRPFQFSIYLLSLMIAQWENECISLSVLSVARVMIAQWENEWIYLTVCPPCDPGLIPGHGVQSQCGRNWLNPLSMAPRNLWTSKRKAAVQPWTDDG